MQGFWYEQGDAAALVHADSKVGGHCGSAWALWVARRKMRRKGRKWKDPSGLFITRQEDKRQAQESRSRKFGNRAVASIIADLLNKKVSRIVSL